ncbi:alpha/beta fold hydrolase [Oceanibacterium hippocampi]|uniref:Soluble epoxide hydrolase n=1 Tax=Oceanibacterium hippocampi TaxID=745714 RepID=A0A1Y5STQ3_9PROT|nr:alpha/beta hydrolase [Oceanibacterium hippocampi]SLN47649.1 Soluble epoxide hydrolase [Oceanibacterium hippocampi]
MPSDETPDWFRQALADKPEEIDLAVDGGTVHVLLWGTGPGRPLILVHGNGAHARWWSFIAPSLASGRRVAALDLGGMGDSGGRANYSPDSFAAELETLARRLCADSGHDAVDIAAHSFGGLVSTWFTYHHPALVNRLVLLDVPFPVERGFRPNWRRQDGRRSIFPSREAALDRFRLLPAQPCENGYLVDYIAGHSIRETAEGWTWKFTANPWDYEPFQGDFWPRLGEAAGGLARPPVLVRGAASALCTAEMEDRWRVLFGDSVEIDVIEGAHHHLMLDQPLRLAAVLAHRTGP